MNVGVALEHGRELVDRLFKGMMVKAECGRSAGLEPPPGGSAEFDWWTIPKDLTAAEKRRIWERYAAEMVRWIEVEGAARELCSPCLSRGIHRGLIDPHHDD